MKSKLPANLNHIGKHSTRFPTTTPKGFYSMDSGSLSLHLFNKSHWRESMTVTREYSAAGFVSKTQFGGKVSHHRLRTRSKIVLCVLNIWSLVVSQ